MKSYVFGAVALAGLFLLGSLMRSPQSQANGAYSTPVSVMNTSANPVLNRDQDNPAQQPFQVVVNIPLPTGGSTFNVPLFTVPFGKRAVIEYLGGHGTGFAPGSYVQLVIDGGGTFGAFPAPLQFLGGGTQILGLLLRAYAFQGTEVLMSVFDPTSSLPASIEVTVSGHYVNIP